MRILCIAFLCLFSAGAAHAGDVIVNGSFEAGLSPWQQHAENAAFEIEKISDAWRSYSLKFDSGPHTRVKVMIQARIDQPGGVLWFDNFRADGLTLENPSFEIARPGGRPPGWQVQFPFSRTPTHPNNHIGTNWEHASDGQLSLRFISTMGPWSYKTVTLKLPKGLDTMRALTSDEMRAWQVVQVKANTSYTVTFDYRMNHDFHGIVRPVVYSDKDGKILADAGWATGHFHDVQALRTKYGRRRPRMVFKKQGEAQLHQEVTVAPNRFLELRADAWTSRPDQITATVICEDAVSGAELARVTRKTGGDHALVVPLVSSSPKVRVRLVGAGAWGQVAYDNVMLTEPQLVPPLQQANWRDIDEAFALGDELGYRVKRGDAATIEGALWLTAYDLRAKGVALKPGDALAINLGTFTARGDEGYRLNVGRDGIQIDAATPRAAQHALMTLVQLVREHDGRRIILPVQIEDWPDMPVRGLVNGTSYMHIMDKEIDKPPGPPPFHQDAYFADLMQMVRWKLNFFMWRNNWAADMPAPEAQQMRNLIDQCRRFHVDLSGFISTISDPPIDLFAGHPNTIEGIFVEDEKIALHGTKPTPFAHPRVLRNASTDVVVTSVDKKIVYKLDRDYVIGGSLGRFENKTFVDSKPFTIARTPNSRIRSGATVLASYDCAGGKNGRIGNHVQYCPSDPVAVKQVLHAVRASAARWKPRMLFIRADEVTRANSDSRCRKRGQPASRILLDHLTEIRDVIHQASPQTQVAMWEDTFSPYHGGYPWGFTEDGPAPPADIHQFVWFYYPRQPSTRGWASLKHSQKFGLTTVGCPWFNLRVIHEWAQVIGEARRRGWNCKGMVDTTWADPPPFANVRETAIVSWRIPRQGEPRWVEFVPPDDD